MPGRGILAIRAVGYRTADPLEPEVAGTVLHAANFRYQMGSYQGIVTIDVPPGTEVVRRDITLSPGRAITGQISGPDGRPVTGVKVYGLEVNSFQVDPLPGATFTYRHPNPGRVETLTFIHEPSRLGAAVDLKGDEAGPIRVSLRPTGAYTGRLVDEDGRPRPGVIMPILFSRNHRGEDILGDHLIRQIQTDAGGRFRAECLVAGVEYQILIASKDNPRGGGYVAEGRSALKAGEEKDLGDVREKKIKD